MKSLHPQLFQDSQTAKADATWQQRHFTMRTVCTCLVLVAAALRSMAKTAASRSSGLWMNKLQSIIDWVKMRAKNCAQVSDGHYCVFRAVNLLLHTLNKKSSLSRSLPICKPRLLQWWASTDLCYLQTAWCTTSHQEGREAKTKQHRSRNPVRVQIP